MLLRTLYLLAVLGLHTGCATLQDSVYEVGLATERDQSDLLLQTVTVGGRTIHYLERPADGPPFETIVLLHGFAASKDHWVRFARYLPDGYRVLAPDLPGHGDNARDTTETYALGTFVDAVRGFLDEVAPGPVHLAGNSLGGQIATEVALADPGRLRSLTLFNPAGVPSPSPSALDSLLAMGENALIPTTRAGYERLTALALGEDPPSFPWPAEAVLVRQYRQRAPFYRRIWHDLFARPVRLPERLPTVSVPTLLIWGTQDGILDVSAADRWATLVPGITVERWDGIGHAPMLERPEQSARRMAAFIE